MQPQSEIALVRKYIHKLGFAIVKEAMLIEDEKFYVAMKAVNLCSQNTLGDSEAAKETETEEVKAVEEKLVAEEFYEKEIFYRYGKVLLEERNPILEQFLRNGKASYEKIVTEISKSESEKTQERCRELEEELRYIEEALGYYQ